MPLTESVISPAALYFCLDQVQTPFTKLNCLAITTITIPGFLDPHRSGPAVDVSILPTGWLFLPDSWIFTDGKPSLKHWSPDFSFLIRHPSGKSVLFDLRMRKVSQVHSAEYPIIAPHVPKDVYDLLIEGPVHPEDIDVVILSHLHFDHTGDVTRFPSAEILVGAGSEATTTPGWPKAEFSPFDGTVLSHPKFRELPSSGTGFAPLGPFPKSYEVIVSSVGGLGSSIYLLAGMYGSCHGGENNRDDLELHIEYRVGLFN
ncbi:uncharacterized protein BP5553_06029 [Venustampulla echinocandica]|uniref:Metallo-beta-lactamase domain-containing protein n=1 Tax=Venustampulla echinocandica TaxID=2656787 RepID=A0A370TMC2_9HELO|nr:uncharacterized protein BP5553_06029 [Venustampulla echinocandica]RDL36677.1 hypothetical protein BP5553_06029 [Venustampulla echinocandica]